MPELPDIEAYVAALTQRVAGTRLLRVRLSSPFLLRSAEPPLAEGFGRKVISVRRAGKRLVLALEGGLFLVLHLMIAGRLQWKAGAAQGARRPREGARPVERAAQQLKVPGRAGLAAFEFESGTLLLTEAGTKRRASLHFLEGGRALADHVPAGLEPLEATEAELAAALRLESHTLKRALTDPHLFSGIGNAYSDEILHAARLSPVTLTGRLSDEEVARLHRATRQVLGSARDRLVAEARERFPEKVTAFREEMAVHGRYGKPCPACGTKVQRIVHAGNEANYCPACQTGGRLLADRALSRLLKGDWPRSIEELEARKQADRGRLTGLPAVPPARPPRGGRA